MKTSIVNLLREVVIVLGTLVFAFLGFLWAGSIVHDQVYTIDKQAFVGELSWNTERLVVDTGIVEVTLTSVYPIDASFFSGQVLDLTVNEHGRYQIGPFPMSTDQWMSFNNLDEHKAVYVSMQGKYAVVRFVKYDKLHKGVLKWLLSLLAAVISFVIIAKVWKKQK